MEISRYSLSKMFANIPAKSRHVELSAILSVDNSGHNDGLIKLSLKAINNARKASMKNITARMSKPPFYPEIWPGEHYKLLAGFVMALKPKIVVEIGTEKGLSALALKKYMPKSSKLVTFDTRPWNSIDTYLKETDFNKNFVQYTDDLSNHEQAVKHSALLKSADLIFVDAAKDGKMEYQFFENFEKIGLKKGAIVIFDDIRVWNMLRFWQEIKKPKIDLTSFGNWSGTGVVQW